MLYSTSRLTKSNRIGRPSAEKVDVQLNKVIRIVVALSRQRLFLDFQYGVILLLPESLHRGMLRKFSKRKFTSAPNLLIQHDFPQQVARLRYRKPPLRFASQLVVFEFSATTSWDSPWTGSMGGTCFRCPTQRLWLVECALTVACGRCRIGEK